MYWVVIAIVSFMAIYTFVNVTFRKEEAPHLPYEEAQERQSRFFEFDMNGWKWLEAIPGEEPSIKPEEVLPLPVSTRPLEDRLDQDLPMDLVTAVPKRPDLVEALGGISVNLVPDETIRVSLQRDPESKDRIGLEAFYKEGRLIILIVRDGKDPDPTDPISFSLSKSDDWSMESCAVSLYTEKTVYEWEIEAHGDEGQKFPDQ